jgi:hypothetical protein
MIRSTFSFTLCALERSSLAAAERRTSELEDLVRPLAVRRPNGDWQIDLDSPKLPELVMLLESLHKKKAAWMSFFVFDEQLIDDGKARAEWFLLEPNEQSHLDQCFLRNVNEEQVYPFGNAAIARPGIHFALWGPDGILVSEQFKAAVEKHRLTGLDFFWVRDTGRYQARQWYVTLPREILGRGLDHPWYDPAKGASDGSDANDPRTRHGQQAATGFGRLTLRKNASFGDPVKDRLLNLGLSASRERFSVCSYPRFLRQYLPRTHFAATMRDTNCDDEIQSNRGLAASRRARDVLLENRLITEEMCTAVKIFDRVPPGVENLDRLYGKAAPLFSAEELARLRAQEATFWAEHVRRPKPARKPDLKRSLSLLRSAKRTKPKNFSRPAAPKAIAEASRALGIKLPVSWTSVLRISNGARIENSPLAAEEACLIVPVEKLAKTQREEVEYYREINSPLPKGFVLAVQTEIGDSIWLDTRRVRRDGDCRVVLMSHETGEQEREWPTVAEFLEELLN